MRDLPPALAALVAPSRNVAGDPSVWINLFSVVATLRVVADLLETSDDGNGDLFFREWAEMIAQPQPWNYDGGTP